MHFNRPGRDGLHGFQSAMTEDVVAKQWAAAGGKRPVPARTNPSNLPGIHSKILPGSGSMQISYRFPATTTRCGAHGRPDKLANIWTQHKDGQFALMG